MQPAGQSIFFTEKKILSVFEKAAIVENKNSTLLFGTIMNALA
jgi:hypothetical protein